MGMTENDLTASYIDALTAWSRCAKKEEVLIMYYKKFEVEK